jgi:hypothetical protein
MVPLATLKDELGVTSTDLDTMLNRAIAQVTSIVRQRTNRWLFGLGAVTGTTSSLTVTSFEHGLRTGAKVRLVDDSGTVTGNYVVASSTRHSFVTTTGLVSGIVTDSSCSVHPYRETYCHGSGNFDLWVPAVLVPIESLVVCRVNDLDVAFTLEDQDADAKSVRLRRNDLTVWRREFDYRGNSRTFSYRRNSPEKSVLLEGYVGLRYLPGDLEMAVLSMCCEMAELEGMPKDIQQSSFEGVSRSRLQGDERKQQLLSQDRVLLSWKAPG